MSSPSDGGRRSHDQALAKKFHLFHLASCKLYKKGQICRFGATWLVEMREPVFDLIKEGEPESGHLVKSDTRTTVLFQQIF